MRKRIGFILILIVFITSCTKYAINDVQISPWDVDVALPLINSTFSVSDIFDLDENSILELIDEESGLLGITYTGNILSYQASDIVEVADQNFQKIISYPDPAFPFSTVDTLYQSEVITLDFETQNLNEVETYFLSLLSGELDLTVQSDIAYVSQVRIQIPKMSKNGIPYQFESALQAGETISDSEALNEYLMDLTQEDLGYNQLKVNYRIIINYNPNLPATGDDISFNLHFNEPKMNYAVGYFGSNTIANTIDTIKIALFNNTIQGHFQFIDPYMHLDFNNSFGFPTEINVTEFKSVHQITGIETPLFLEGITEAPFEISFPVQIGDSTLDQYYFDNSNSNIQTILNDGDKYIIWGIEAISNPNGQEGPFNFIDHKSKMEATTRVTIPLKGYAWDWVFTDTTHVDSGGIGVENPEEINDLTLRLIIDNGFPAEGVLQIYTTDSLFQITDSLFDGPSQILESGILINGIVSEASKTITDIALTDDKREHVLNAGSFITLVKMQTTNGSEQEVIQIYSDYSIGLIMGVRATIKIDPNSL